MMTREAVKLDRLEDGLDALRRGNFVIVIDDEDRENEGDLIASAAHMTKEKMAFMIRYTTGIICCPMSASRASALELPPMVKRNTDAKQTAFTVSTDYMHGGVSTGVSAADRAVTCLALAGVMDAGPADFSRPGHVFPLVAKAGGVLERAGHTEAAVDLLKLVGHDDPVGVIGEIVLDNGDMARYKDLFKFSRDHGDIPLISIRDLAEYLSRGPAH